MRIKVWIIAKLEWDKHIPQDLCEIYVSSTRRINPGENPVSRSQKKLDTLLERPAFATFASPAGFASLVIRCQSGVMPLVVLIRQKPEIISLPFSPKAVSARSDGVWVLGETNLLHCDLTGHFVKTIPVGFSGTRLIGTSEDNVWIVSGQRVQFVNAKGDAREPYKWNNRSPVSLSGDNICWLDYEIEKIRCLDPGGSEQVTAPPVSRLGGVLTAILEDRLLTSGLFNTYLCYKFNGEKFELNVITAGLTTQGEAFVAIDKDGVSSLVDVYLSDGSVRQIPGHLPVVAIDGERTLTYRYNHAEWYRSGRLETRFTVNPSNYLEEIFPYEWNSSSAWMTFIEPTVTSNGTIILSATGPDGLVVIGLRWTP